MSIFDKNTSFLISGKEFKENVKYNSLRYYITYKNEEKCLNIGLNILPENHKIEIRSQYSIDMSFEHYGNPHYSLVTFPDDAIIDFKCELRDIKYLTKAEGSNYACAKYYDIIKTDKVIVISNSPVYEKDEKNHPIPSEKNSCFYEDVLRASPRVYHSLLKHVYNQTPDLVDYCLKNGNDITIKHIKNITPSLCETAINYNANFFVFMEKSHITPKIIEMAIKKKGELLKHVEKEQQTFDICKLAILQCPQAIEFVFDQTEELIALALEKNGDVLKHIKIQTPLMCKMAIKVNYRALQHVKNKTDDIVIFALQQSAYAINYVEKVSETIIGALPLNIQTDIINYLVGINNARKKW